MTSGVIHQPRVAWDAARALVEAAQAGSTMYFWYHHEVQELLGPEYAGEFAVTRIRLGEEPDHSHVEAGKWRVRLEDVLRTQPHLAEDLNRLTADARLRLA
jgi:hypothetical protein